MRSVQRTFFMVFFLFRLLRADLLLRSRHDGGTLASESTDQLSASSKTFFLGGTFRREALVASKEDGIMLTSRQRTLLVVCTIVAWSLLIFVSTYTLCASALDEKAKSRDAVASQAWKDANARCHGGRDTDVDFLEDRFEEALLRVSEALRSQRASMATQEDTQMLYGLYKQALFGDAQGPRPWSLMRRRCAKWDRWASMRGMSREDAMARYVATARIWLGGEKSCFDDGGDGVRNIDDGQSSNERLPREAAVKSLKHARRRFDDAVDAIGVASHAGEVTLSNESKLKLYALYKQANEGDVQGSQPSAWNVQRKAMWDAWAGAKGLPEDVAMGKYVETVNELLGQQRNDDV